MESLRHRSRTAIESAQPISLRILTPIGQIRTTGSSSVVLDGLSLAVECVVSGPRGKLGVGAVETALDGGADRSSTQLLGSTLGQTKGVTLREHGWRWMVWRE